MSTAQDLAAKLDNRTATVGILGLGYVGLPVALAFAEAGFPVLGFDTDEQKIDALLGGDCYIRHIDGDAVTAAVESGKLTPTADFDRLGEADALLICVPTPLTRQRQPDLRFVRATADEITARLRPGQMVILESTTYPGTTDELLKPLLEASGLVCGDDLFLAFSPEREDPGNPDHTATRVPKVVGGVDEVSGRLAAALYDAIVPRTVLVSSARAAEAAKLTENVFRAVNIALVNELKMVYDRMDIDVWEVLDAAETKPFGFMRFNPGPGWGGHCIPLDPFYLSWKAREHGITPHFIELAGEVNDRTQRFVVERLVEALNDQGKPVNGSAILVLGLAYKKNVDDPRESPAFELIDQLLSRGAQVGYHDPHIPIAPAMRSWPKLPPMTSVDLTPQALGSFDAVVVVTDHADVDYEAVAKHAPLIVDTRGVFRTSLPNVVKA